MAELAISGKDLQNMMAELITYTVTQMAIVTTEEIAARLEKHFVVEPTLTLAEAAEQLGLSVQSMRALCREKRIPAIRLEKSYRIRVIDINRFLEKHMQATE